jgi:hypothetical protein
MPEGMPPVVALTDPPSLSGIVGSAHVPKLVRQGPDDVPDFLIGTDEHFK